MLLCQAESLYDMFYKCHTVQVRKDVLERGKKHNPVCRYGKVHSCCLLLPYENHELLFHRQCLESGNLCHYDTLNIRYMVQEWVCRLVHRKRDNRYNLQAQEEHQCDGHEQVHQDRQY